MGWGIEWSLLVVGEYSAGGFEVNKKSYASFTEQSRIGNKKAGYADAVWLWPGRLRLGALVANFSIPLMLVSLYALFGFDK